jgi:hypothetical protein
VEKPRCALFAAAITVAVVALLSSCGSSPVAKRPVLQGENIRAVDFSGSWELDYAQSDNVQEKVNSLARELNREAERIARGGMHQGPVGGAMVSGYGAASGEAILGMVRMADLVTQSPLLQIQQSANDIRVRREGDFDLTCEFYPGELSTVETPFGIEICGWKAHQLVFRLLLPDGLRIQHVMTMGAAGQKLQIATTVSTDQVSFPFSLNRVYNRFEPGESGYKCEVTLTRGTVCSTQTR